MRRHILSVFFLLPALLGVAPSGALAQTLELASRGPRFIAAWKLAGEAVDVSNAVVLRRRVSLDLTNVTADEALKEITRQADLEISYSRVLLPNTKSVSLHVRQITVAAALTEILLDADVDVAVARGGHLALVKRVPSVASTGASPVDSGAISGRVTDKASGAPLVGATVTIEGTQHIANTESDGRYHLADVPVGSHTLRARYIGYMPLAVSVMVASLGEATADFMLQKSVQVLDDVVTTGTLVPTAVAALPTPITVVTDSEIALRRPTTLMDLFRQTVPTAVSWNSPASPNFAPFAVRGANTLIAGNLSQMKVFLDGIEVAIPVLSGVTPSSIERLEVIRGPQAAALYGSDAIGGVIQIFTKRGSPGLTKPQADAEASVAAIQTPYDGADGVVRPSFRGSIRGSGADVSYTFLADYSHTADWLPNQEAPQSRYGASGGVRYTRGPIMVDLSGRYNVFNGSLVSNPELTSTGWSDFSRPYYRYEQTTNQTLGTRVGVTATKWWHHTVRVGLDQYTSDLRQDRPRLTTPDDTLLWVLNSTTTKTYFAYNSIFEGHLGPELSASLTTGFDHYRLPSVGFSTFGALNTRDVIRTIPGTDAISASRTFTSNTGYFVQAQVGFRDALFLTAGLRGEQNTHFGDSLGTQLAPRVGLSYVHGVGEARLKFRGSWGRAIRAPDPGAKSATSQAGFFVNLANPLLGPERQQGWDAGIDAVLGGRGSLSVTYYAQTADNLIQQVQLETVPLSVTQYQNVGRVRNSGVEVEGAFGVGPLRVKGQYGYARARIEQLAPNYEGDLRIGDQVPNTPKHTAGVSLSATPVARTTLTAGLTYVGSWREYDYFAIFSCFGGTGPCQASFRDYLVEYPDFTKVNAGVFREIGPFLSGFVTVDNLTNKKAVEGSNIAPVWGRMTSIGLQFQY